MAKDTNEQRPNPSQPIRRGDLHRYGLDVRATAEVPEHLRYIDLFPNLSPFELVALERQSLSAASTEPVPPYCPKWVSSSRRPRRPALVGEPKTKLWHRGIYVDPLFVWGDDDRVSYTDSSHPWGCVCRIMTSAGWGSGVIVGPRHVLTASHVVDWVSNGAGTVEVNRAGFTANAATAITRVWAFKKISPPVVGYSEVDEDYAVLITADRIGDRFGSLGVRTYDSSWDDEPIWFSMGYASDTLWGSWPVKQQDKELDEDEFDLGSARSMTTTADTVKGQSGSPMFTFWEDGPYVVAVISAQGTFVLSGDENWCAGGTDLTRLVHLARAGDP